jgi:hypothetical protein
MLNDSFKLRRELFKKKNHIDFDKFETILVFLKFKKILLLNTIYKLKEQVNYQIKKISDYLLIIRYFLHNSNMNFLISYNW